MRVCGRRCLHTNAARGEDNLGKLHGAVLILQTIADKHQVSIANIAVCAILERLAMAGVLVGYAWGVVGHIIRGNLPPTLEDLSPEFGRMVAASNTWPAWNPIETYNC